MSLDSDHEQLLSPKGRRESGGATIRVGKDQRLSAVLEFAQPVLTGLVLAGILYFANQVGKIGDALVATNTQIAVMIEQNKMLTDGYKDHENRIRAIEGNRFRGVPGYGEPVEDRHGH